MLSQGFYPDAYLLSVALSFWGSCNICDSGSVKLATDNGWLCLRSTGCSAKGLEGRSLCLTCHQTPALLHEHHTFKTRSSAPQ